jgi:hypothetical protein
LVGGRLCRHQSKACLLVSSLFSFRSPFFDLRPSHHLTRCISHPSNSLEFKLLQTSPPWSTFPSLHQLVLPTRSRR